MYADAITQLLAGARDITQYVAPVVLIAVLFVMFAVRRAAER